MILRITSLLFACFLFLAVTPARASVNDTALRAKLTALSAEMADQGNEHFIIVAAVLDGLLNLGDGYAVTFTPSSATINGKQLTGSMKKKYVQLMLDFYRSLAEPQHKDDPYDSYSASGSVDLEDILNPDSRFRKQSEITERQEREKRDAVTYDDIIAEMAKDGLADTTQSIDLYYDAGKITVNDKQLDTAALKKYQPLFLSKLLVQSGDSSGYVRLQRSARK